MLVRSSFLHDNIFYIESWLCRFSDILERGLDTLSPRQNGRHFPDIFKCIFFNENVWISMKISLKFLPKGTINSTPALVQEMAWHRTVKKLLSEPMMVNLLTHTCVTGPQWVNNRTIGWLYKIREVVWSDKYTFPSIIFSSLHIYV